MRKWIIAVIAYVPIWLIIQVIWQALDSNYISLANFITIQILTFAIILSSLYYTHKLEHKKTMELKFKDEIAGRKYRSYDNYEKYKDLVENGKYPDFEEYEKYAREIRNKKYPNYPTFMKYREMVDKGYFPDYLQYSEHRQWVKKGFPDSYSMNLSKEREEFTQGGYPDYKTYKNTHYKVNNGSFGDYASYMKYHQEMEKEGYSKLSEYLNYREQYAKVLGIIEKVNPNVQLAVTRIEELTGIARNEIEKVIKRILDQHKIGQYMELEQVFIKFDDIQNDIDSLLSEYEKDGRMKI
ncbi:MAG: hypothetical protein INQ03_09170 [Candidatus Heimdallarchaeota archaeon]|nr:hypothetical protein [Candidatus Heimdallarchaeota archaeon]